MQWNTWSRADLASYFQTTYVGIEENGTTHACYVQKISEEVGTGGSLIIGKGRREPIYCSFNNPALRVVVPESRYVNTHYQAVYLSRKTSRQYKKGIDLKYYVKEFTNPWVKTALGTGFRDVDYVEGLLSNTYPSLYKAVRLIRRGEKASVAFSKHFCVSLDEKLEGLCLYYRGLLCGTVDDQDRIILSDQCVALQDKLIDIEENAQ